MKGQSQPPQSQPRPETEPAWLTALLAISALLFLGGGGMALLARHAQGEARARWAEVAANVGGSGYDRTVSDARYLEVEHQGDRIELGVKLLAAGALGGATGLVALRRRARRRPRARGERTDRRA